METIVTFGLLTLASVNSECPYFKGLPVMTDDNQFYCAHFWDEWGAADALDACNGDIHSVLDDTDHDSGEGKYSPMGSLVVMPGCTYYGYNDYGYSGTKVTYDTTAHYYTEGCLHNVDNYRDCNRQDGNCGWHHSANEGELPCGYQSYKCRCRQEPIECIPKDYWNTVMTCDNSQSAVETTCTYQKSIGTTWTQTAQNSFNIDEGIEESMKAGFFDFFEVEIGISINTGYDWTHISTEAKEEVETYTVSQIVPSHTILVIEGAEGECSGNIVKTEMFRIRDVFTNEIWPINY